MTTIQPEDCTQDTRLPWRGIVASLVRQLGRQAAVFDTDIAYETGTLTIARTGDGYTFAVRDVPWDPQAADVPGAPACYGVTRVALIDAIGNVPLCEHLNLEARGKMADALLGQMPAVPGDVLARLAELENAIGWNTSCLSCAAVLDSGIREHERAERAEEKLAAHLEDLRAVLPHRVGGALFAGEAWARLSAAAEASND